MPSLGVILACAVCVWLYLVSLRHIRTVEESHRAWWSGAVEQEALDLIDDMHAPLDVEHSRAWEGDEPLYTQRSVPIEVAVTRLVSIGNVLRKCSTCESNKVTCQLERFFIYEGELQVRSLEHCEDCGDDRAYVIPVLHWIATAASQEWDKYQVARDVTLSELDVVDLDAELRALDE